MGGGCTRLYASRCIQTLLSQCVQLHFRYSSNVIFQFVLFSNCSFVISSKLRAVLQQIITFEGINIEIVGCWIWVDGNTYDYKDTNSLSYSALISCVASVLPFALSG